jgi:hypothetical protein
MQRAGQKVGVVVGEHHPGRLMEAGLCSPTLAARSIRRSILSALSWKRQQPAPRSTKRGAQGEEQERLSGWFRGRMPAAPDTASVRRERRLVISSKPRFPSLDDSLSLSLHGSSALEGQLAPSSGGGWQKRFSPRHIIRRIMAALPAPGPGSKT